MKKYSVGLLLLLCLNFPFSAFAGEPLEAVKGHVDKVLDVLSDPSLKTESAKKARKDKIRAIAEEMLDFTELSKRTLAQNWSRLKKVK
jgi:phospholipid transport system substrate-binding protein